MGSFSYRSVRLVRSLFILLCAAFAPPGQAQAAASAADIPSDCTMRLVLPYPPGGSTDVIARHIAQQLSTDWKRPLVVDNRPGASGMIGTELVARSPANGCTALFAITQHIQNPLLYPKVAYDPIKDFTPVARILTVPTGLAVPVDLPVDSAAALIKLIRSEPGKHSFGSTGTASTSHIYGGLFSKTAHLDAVHVAYKGAGPMLTDLLGGRISFTIVDVGSLMPHVRAGKLKILAVSGTQRFETVKDVPTFAEAGIPGFETTSWMGIFLPAGTPSAARDKWASALDGYLNSADFAEKLRAMGILPDPLLGKAFAEQLARDIPLWKSMISTADVRPE